MSITEIKFKRVCDICGEEFTTNDNAVEFCDDCEKVNQDTWDEMFLEKFHSGGFVRLYQKYGFGFHDARSELMRIGEILPNLQPSKNASKADMIVELASEGALLTRVAHEADVDKSGLRRFCDNHYIVFQDAPKVADYADDIEKMASEGQSLKNIAEYIEYSETSISRFCKKNGIKVRNPYHQHIIIAKGKYILVDARNHPNADNRGYVRLHRLILEMKLGRYLTDKEDGHHKDGNTFNNDPENLEVMTRSEHTSLHAKQGDVGFGKNTSN